MLGPVRKFSARAITMAFAGGMLLAGMGYMPFEQVPGGLAGIAGALLANDGAGPEPGTVRGHGERSPPAWDGHQPPRVCCSRPLSVLGLVPATLPAPAV